MCGIVGLFAKSPGIEDRLGAHLAAMLRQMSDRGPDSAGVAVDVGLDDEDAVDLFGGVDGGQGFS